MSGTVREWDDDPRLAGARREVYRTVDGVGLTAYAFGADGGKAGAPAPGI